MNAGFSFPPPPPPPSRSATAASNQQGQLHQNGTGAQSHRERQGARGGRISRGHLSGRGNSSAQSSHSRGGSSSAWHNDNSNLNHSRTSPNNGKANATMYWPQTNQIDPGTSLVGHQEGTSHPRTLAGHKRKLDALKPPDENPKKQGPPTAPSVPSFGASFVSPKPSTILQNSSPNLHKAGSTSGRKGLGLTPDTPGSVALESDDEADTLDEEAMYAELGNKLTFEHNGVVMSLKSQADLVAWKNARQRNWPTRGRKIEKDDERRRIGEERRRLLRIATPLSRFEDSRQLKAKQLAGKKVSESVAPDPDERAKRLSELRQKALDSEAKNREASTQARQSEVNAAVIGAPPDSPDEMPDQSKVDPPINLAAGYESASEHEAAAENPEENSSETSSDSSSDSASNAASDDDAPEVMTTKPLQARVEVDARSVCRIYANRGYCRYGDACRFRHERSATTASAVTSGPQRDQETAKKGARSENPALTARKGILQRLKEQERDEEDRMALQVIKYLGKAAFFNRESPKNDQ